MKAGIGAALLALILAPVVLFAAMDAPPPPAPTGPLVPSALALADIPPDYLALYQSAASTYCPGLSWTILAAIGKVESDHGRDPAAMSGPNSAGAEGPMQFLPSTFAAYAGDYNSDGSVSIYDPGDAIPAAAKMLCADGAATGPQGLHDAIFAYNHAEWYVQKVLDQAAAYGQAAATGTGDAAALLTNPNLILTDNARSDLSTPGVVDQRVIDFLAWAVQRHTITVSVIKTGHNEYVHGTDRVSNHYYGRAADIAAVDGAIVEPSCTGCKAFAGEIIALGQGRPDELGLPWADLAGTGGSMYIFSDGDHQNHLHVGWSQ